MQVGRYTAGAKATRIIGMRPAEINISPLFCHYFQRDKYSFLIKELRYNVR